MHKTAVEYMLPGEGVRGWGTEFLYEMMRKFGKWIVVKVAQHREYTNTTELYPQKWLKW